MSIKICKMLNKISEWTYRNSNMLYKISDMLYKLSHIGYKISTKEDISFIQSNKMSHILYHIFI